MTFDVIYHCDAHPAIGMGHLMRALSVLRELGCRSLGLRLGLAGGFSDSALSGIERWLPQGVTFLAGMETPCSSRLAVLDTMARPGDPTALDTARVADLKGLCGRLILVSSAVEVRVTDEVDVLIDHMPEVRIQGPRPARCEIGLKFAPVAGEFFEVTAAPLEESSALVVVIGGSDRQTGPETVLELLTPHVTAQFSTLQMVVSPHFPLSALGNLRGEFPSWAFFRNVPSVVPFLANARAVICTYGNVTYESLALGRPTFVLGYEPFQEEYAHILEARGLVANCGLFDVPNTEKLEGLCSPDLLLKLHGTARETLIGCGVRAIADVLLEELTVA